MNFVAILYLILMLLLQLSSLGLQYNFSVSCFNYKPCVNIMYIIGIGMRYQNMNGNFASYL